ncbi:hypothetical protein B0O99DRAFT_48858 [Bisporella sp. PMI_857]|nr:hypothetical protein B0O99DRAFT_48858 [Bisporella sp. PMI_857]
MAAQIPLLPPELWFKVIESHESDQNLPEMWLTWRHVSKTFQNVVETIFQESVLPRTCIRFLLGGIWDEGIEALIERDVELKLLKLSEDKKIATFYMPEYLPRESHKPYIRNALQKYITDEDLEYTSHRIQVRTDLTDGPIPGLSIDYEKLELSFDWKELYTVFYSEVQVSTRLITEWVEGQKIRHSNLRSAMEAGQLDMERMMHEILHGFEQSHRSSAKAARRLRIKKMKKQKDPDSTGEIKDTLQEANILRDLAEERRAIASEFGDTDDEDEDDSEDEEDSENAEEGEDEWEDEDASDAGND